MTPKNQTSSSLSKNYVCNSIAIELILINLQMDCLELQFLLKNNQSFNKNVINCRITPFYNLICNHMHPYQTFYFFCIFQGHSYVIINLKLVTQDDSYKILKPSLRSLLKIRMFGSKYKQFGIFIVLFFTRYAIIRLYQSFKFKMPNFIKSSEYHKAMRQLQYTGFFSTDISNFHTKQIENLIVSHQSNFLLLAQIFDQIKLNTMRVLKIQLIIQRLLQVDRNMRDNQNLLQFICRLSLKVQKLIGSQVTYAIKQYTEPQQKVRSSRYLITQNGIVCQNAKSIILKKIIEPFLELQKRLIFSYELISPCSETQQLELSQCWAVLNLLKKFLEFTPQIQAIGRYYSDKYAASMIYLVKVLDTDIQLLYQRIKIFADAKIRQFRSVLKQVLSKKSCEGQRTRIHQFLQLIEQVQSINESIKLLYISKSFKVDFANNNIKVPALFTTETHIDLLYLLKKVASSEQEKIWSAISKRNAVQQSKSLMIFA